MSADITVMTEYLEYYENKTGITHNDPSVVFKLV